MKALVSLALLVSAWLCMPAWNALSQAYTFTTIAGSPGVPGSDDGTNGDARFNFPVGIAVDAHGALYVCDQLNNTVRQVRPEGRNWVVRTLAGVPGVRGFVDGTNSQAQFDRPTGVVVDRDGNVFVSDKYNNTIRKLTPVGTNWVVTTIAGEPGVRASEDGTNNAAHFWGPAGLALNSAGELFVADSSNFTIRRIVSVGTNWVVSTVAGTPLNYGAADGVNELASFNYPWALSADASGVLYVADYGNQLVRRIEHVGADWVTTTIAGMLDVMGTNDGPGYQASFKDLNGICAGTTSEVFVADYGNHTVRGLRHDTPDWMVSTLGGLPTVSGTNDGPGTQARFYHPRDICFDRTGAIFITDYSNHTIRMGVSAPTLEIVAFGNQAVLSWPLWADGYLLQTATALAPNPHWMPVTNDVFVSGNSFVLTNEPAVSGFFRLILQ